MNGLIVAVLDSIVFKTALPDRKLEGPSLFLDMNSYYV